MSFASPSTERRPTDALFPSTKKATLMNPLQIHLITAEATDTSAIVKGHVSGGVVGGQSGTVGMVHGRTDTILSTHIFYENRAYTLSQVNGKLPIRAGDRLLVLCRKTKTGEWGVLSVLNLSNGTSYRHSSGAIAIYLWAAAFLSLFTIFFGVGLVLAPLMLYLAGKFTFVTMPQIQAANARLTMIEALPPEARDASITDFNTSPPTSIARTPADILAGRHRT